MKKLIAMLVLAGVMLTGVVGCGETKTSAPKTTPATEKDADKTGA